MKVKRVVLKKDAKPIDNKTKWAYGDDDYETVIVDEPDPPKDPNAIDNSIESLQKENQELREQIDSMRTVLFEKI